MSNMSSRNGGAISQRNDWSVGGEFVLVDFKLNMRKFKAYSGNFGINPGL